MKNETTKLMLQNHGLAVIAGYKRPRNDNIKRMRLEDIDARIAFHENNISNMVGLASTCKDSRERRKIALEIGYSRIELDCILKPLKERLEEC